MVLHAHTKYNMIYTSTNKFIVGANAKLYCLKRYFQQSSEKKKKHSSLLKKIYRRLVWWLKLEFKRLKLKQIKLYKIFFFFIKNHANCHRNYIERDFSGHIVSGISLQRTRKI